MDDRKQLKELVAEHGITAEAKLVKVPDHMTQQSKGRVRIDGRPSKDWDKSAFHWTAVLKFGDRRLEVARYKTGCGWVKALRPLYPGVARGPELAQIREPDAADILSSLCSDAACGQDTFEDFCGNMGLDTDSRRAMDTYLECQAQYGRLIAFLGKHYQAFVEAEH